MKPVVRHVLATTVVWLTGTAAVAAAVIWTGAYDIGADAPHYAPIKAVLDTTVKRSIAVRAADLKVPPLGDPARVVQGAGNYEAMCVQCHLAPGKDQTELSKGLYPSPPNLTEQRLDPARVFWVIKHGIKASGMPAWGKSMEDEYIWDMAAFLQKLPEMNQQQYQNMVASSGGHSHGGGESSTAFHDGGKEGGHHSSGEGKHESADKPSPDSNQDGAPAGTAANKTANHHDDTHKH